MGLLNLFKREVPEVGFEFEDLERMFGNLQLKSHVSLGLTMRASETLQVWAYYLRMGMSSSGSNIPLLAKHS